MPNQKDVDLKLKLVIIASASQALNYKKKNPQASDDDVLRHITKITKEIIREAY